MLADRAYPGPVTARRWWLAGGAAVLAGVLLCGVAGFAAWPRTDLVAQVPVAPQPVEQTSGAGPAEVVLVRKWSFFGLRERHTLYAGRGVVVDRRPLTLCGTTYPVADPGDPPAIEAVVPATAGYEVRFGSGELVTVPSEAMTPCR